MCVDSSTPSPSAAAPTVLIASSVTLPPAAAAAVAAIKAPHCRASLHLLDTISIYSCNTVPLDLLTIPHILPPPTLPPPLLLSSSWHDVLSCSSTHGYWCSHNTSLIPYSIHQHVSQKPNSICTHTLHIICKDTQNILTPDTMHTALYIFTHHHLHTSLRAHTLAQSHL